MFIVSFKSVAITASKLQCISVLAPKFGIARSVPFSQILSQLDQLLSAISAKNFSISYRHCYRMYIGEIACKTIKYELKGRKFEQSCISDQLLIGIGMYLIHY